MENKHGAADLIHAEFPGVSPRPTSKQEESLPGSYSYPHRSSLREFYKMTNAVEGKDYMTWTDQGFNLQEAISSVPGPIIEIGGPSLGGFYFLDGIRLPTKPIVTNIAEGVLQTEMPEAIDETIDGRNLPYGDSSVGAVLMQAIDLIDTSIPPNTPEGDKALELAEQEMDRLANGTMELKEVQHALRPPIYLEVWRVLASGGLFITDAHPAEMAVLQKLGFEVVAYRQEEIKNPEGIVGYEGIDYDLVLRKP